MKINSLKKFYLIFLASLTSNILFGQQSNFERYIDSLINANNTIKIKDINSFFNREYDSVKKENNVFYFIEACFKDLGIENYLDKKSKFLKKNLDVKVKIYINNNGKVYNVAVNEKKLEKYIRYKLIGRDFFLEYASMGKINGKCLPKADIEFYKMFFEFGIVINYEYGDYTGGNKCNC